MEFFNKIRSKPSIWIGTCILVVVLLLAVLVLPKDKNKTGETDVSLENSGETLEADSAGALETSDESTEGESKADNKTTDDGTSGDKTSADGNTGDKKTDQTETTAAGKQETSSSGNAQGGVQEETEAAKPDDVTISNFSSFSGQFVEDGTDELVENVAAILVTNTSGQFLDLATLEYTINGKAATFVATGLPAGKSAWVMEKNRMTISGNASFQYQDCTTSLRDGVVASTDKITITSDGNMLIATNNTKKTLKNVFVYYKSVHTDGNFFGGITYMVNFGTLEPGGSAESIAGHYVKDETKIVRIGWQE